MKIDIIVFINTNIISYIYKNLQNGCTIYIVEGARIKIKCGIMLCYTTTYTRTYIIGYPFFILNYSYFVIIMLKNYIYNLYLVNLTNY